MTTDFAPGQISWKDLTVSNAKPIRDFYESVIGWKPSPVPMGDYSDYSMIDSAGNAVAGVCHARGENANLPPCWLMYVTVDDLDSCITKCNESGGAVVDGPRLAGGARIAVIRDPAGAVLALYEPDCARSGSDGVSESD